MKKKKAIRDIEDIVGWGAYDALGMALWMWVFTDEAREDMLDDRLLNQQRLLRDQVERVLDVNP